MRLFQKLTPEPHVSFHLEEFSLPASHSSSLAAILGSLGLPHTEHHKTLKQNTTKHNTTQKKGKKVGWGKLAKSCQALFTPINGV